MSRLLSLSCSEQPQRPPACPVRSINLGWYENKTSGMQASRPLAGWLGAGHSDRSMKILLARMHEHEHDHDHWPLATRRTDQGPRPDQPLFWQRLPHPLTHMLAISARYGQSVQDLLTERNLVGYVHIQTTDTKHLNGADCQVRARGRTRTSPGAQAPRRKCTPGTLTLRP